MAGVHVHCGKVELDIKGVDAEAMLKVRLENLYDILDRALTTIDRNPQILEALLKTVDTAVDDIGQTAQTALGPGGAGTKALDQVGQTAQQALGPGGAGTQALDQVGGAAQQAVGPGGAVTQAGQKVGAAADKTGQAVGGVATEVGADAGARLTAHVRLDAADDDPLDPAAAKPGRQVRVAVECGVHALRDEQGGFAGVVQAGESGGGRRAAPGSDAAHGRSRTEAAR